MNTAYRIYRVEKKDICFLRYTIEAYDGVAIVTTLDAGEGIVALSVAPGCETELDEIMHGLEKEMRLEFLPDQTEYAEIIPWRAISL